MPHLLSQWIQSGSKIYLANFLPFPPDQILVSLLDRRDKVKIVFHLRIVFKLSSPQYLIQKLHIRFRLHNSPSKGQHGSSLIMSENGKIFHGIWGLNEALDPRRIVQKRHSHWRYSNWGSQIRDIYRLQQPWDEGSDRLRHNDRILYFQSACNIDHTRRLSRHKLTKKSTQHNI